MNEIAGIIVPFFGMILLGFAAGRFELVKAAGLSGLNFFVFYMAMPALFFQLVSATPLSAFQGFSFILATTFATYCVFAIAFSVGALLNGGNVSEATIQGLIGSYSNVSYMAPALTIAAFGTAAAMPTALILGFDTALVLALTPLMMAMGGAARTDPRLLAETIARQVLLHPLILAATAGFIFSAIGIGLPGPVDGLLSSLRVAALPCALFLLGVGLSERTLNKIPVEMPILVAIKLVVHPLVVYLLLSWIGG
ncbi:MAG: AEC family transporter, partial [Alphaproteobacteria bacterium]